MQFAQSPYQRSNPIDENVSSAEKKNLLIRRLLVVAGLPIDNLSMDETLDRIDLFIRQGRKDGRTRQVATINADFVVKAADDPELRYLLQGADLATADGMPLVWGAKMLGVKLPGRVTGADLVPAIAQRAAKKGYSIYLFGSTEGIAKTAAEKLSALNPGLNIVGAVSPPFSSVIDMDQKQIDDIHDAKPDILLVALGNPKQEKFIGMYKNDLGVPVAIGIGGTLDFIAGKTSRAPVWMQKSGTEWIYRMVSDPGRLVKRYAHDLVGFTRFFGSQWLHMRNSEKTDALLPKQEIIVVDGKVNLNLNGRFDMANNDKLSSLLEQALIESAKVDINLENALFLDSVAIGTLLGCTRIARDRKGDIRLINVPPTIFKTLKLLKLDRFFEILTDGQHMTPADANRVMRTEKHIIIQTPPVFDANTSRPMLKSALAEIQPGKSVILDFTQTRLLASAGLAAVAKLNHEIMLIGGSLKLANCSDDILRVFQMVKYDILFPILDTLPE